jgi:hypothetical protein
MGNGKWEMGNGKWEMGNGKWEMGNGRCKGELRVGETITTSMSFGRLYCRKIEEWRGLML